MTTVIKFLFYEDLGDKIGAIYYTDDSNKDKSGKYVSLADYQALEKHLDEIGTLTYAELVQKNRKLRQLLERVDAIDYETFNDEAKYHLLNVLDDIKEVLKK